MKLLPLFATLASLTSLGSSKPTAVTSPFINARAPNGTLLQDVVTWDADSIFVHGERLFLFSGDFAPFRLPVPSLWLDTMQKIKAAGFNAISFYPDWALLEGKRGEVSMDGVFDLEPFFDAAKEAGVYLIARQGPYIHSETAGGGFPGWMQRVKGTFRTTAPDYLSATDLYMKKVGAIISEAQITNGGPVILVQVENEYSQFNGKETGPNGDYFQYVIDQARDAGIVVPIVNNDAHNNGIGAPGNGTGAVDIYGYDSYPIGVGCWNLYDWPAGNLKENYWSLHLEKSPYTPHYIAEFQGGSGSGWGDEDADTCYESVNEVFSRVVYKNNYAAAVKTQNLYPVFGGTNWGNLGYPVFVTSYDVGGTIREDRTLRREKFAEMRLQGEFFKVTPAYYSSRPTYSDSHTFTNTSALRVTRLGDQDSDTSLFVIRHTAYESREVTPYRT
ncbi:hypothetical protein N8T08_002521 [Aspergillus melleus]|uniref:Uncharacterized protein n=1 Tax=Aspergillus melleus TaxID=138277 RepID=A0ACC3B8K7_9EURO|nr:hypothetical protein N8T08_002521 [Aspergillus melleus]